MAKEAERVRRDIAEKEKHMKVLDWSRCFATADSHGESERMMTMLLVDPDRSGRTYGTTGNARQFHGEKTA